MESEDPVISRIGNFGRWQVDKSNMFYMFFYMFMAILQAKRIGIVSMVGWVTAWQMLAVSFLIPSQDFWCSPDHLELSGAHCTAQGLARVLRKQQFSGLVSQVY